ncbi:unnamed protein product [Blepharisma stoltei]|uniref:Peptide deformylase n=1 Tax=Blepharisma stoltei TaxID=1481888 RepID=A0AAU9J2S3_9CILI|nr:unnamed protein product [Blepharisma stoltei]
MSKNVEILYHTTKNIVLRSIAKPVTFPLNEEMLEIIDNLVFAIRYRDMVWTNYGLSISAPQIGEPYRMFIASPPKNWIRKAYHRTFDYYINPEIVWKSNETSENWEGCLSIPKYEYLVRRHNSVTVEYYDLRGKKKQKTVIYTEANVIQHDIDHLNGKLVSDNAFQERLILRKEPEVTVIDYPVNIT